MWYSLRKKKCISQEFKNESEFQTYLNKKWEEKWYVYYKLSDFDTKNLKPCDCICTNLWWVTSWIELKYTKTDVINVKKLEPQQKAYLKKVADNGWRWMVVIYSLKEKAYISFTIKDFLKHANNAWTVNLFWPKLPDINKKEKKVEKFNESEMVDNICL